MIVDQIILFSLLAVVLALFVWGKWRYDIVALSALLVITLLGFSSFEEAFTSFGHPAVIIVAAVLVISQGMLNSGVVDQITRWLSLSDKHPLVQVLILSSLVAFASAFINNIGALALFIPIAVRTAKKSDVSPSIFLMPLAFASHLGGYITLIGASPNIIVSSFRAEHGLAEFNMFAFASVGIPVALIGLVFISFVGWRLLPKRSGGMVANELLEEEDYVTEMKVVEESEVNGKTLHDLREMIKDEFTILALVRSGWRNPEPSRFDQLHVGDTLVVQAESDILENLSETAGLELVGGKSLKEGVEDGDEVTVSEVVVAPDALISGKTAKDVGLRQWYHVNLLAVSRHGERLKQRLADIRLQPSDVLILQGPEDHIARVCKYQGCLPLAHRELHFGHPRKIMLAVGIFLAAILLATFGVVPAHIAFLAAALAMVITGMIPIKELYQSIDWSLVVLLGSMIQIGLIFENSGAAKTIAGFSLSLSEFVSPVLLLALVLVVTMLISDVINGTTVAVLMAPVSIVIAQGIGASIDPFLIAVAIGASSSYLTPVGHQSNMLVMGPGGYKFSDYWKIGLPLEILIAAVSIPLILYVWPLF